VTYIKQLDSLRAIAVLLVIITHWFSETSKLNIYTGVFSGVDIFFVLSGFLITKILFENRELSQLHNTSRRVVIRSFYMRRFLRIFPIYYITLTVLYIIGPATGTAIRQTFPYFITYTSNFYFFSAGHWDGMLSHLWSLSVEEQFYLLWPWLMLYVNRKYLLSIVLASIAIGIGTQWALRNHGLGDIFTLSCFDGFGFGALLAWAWVYKSAVIKKYYVPLLCVSVAAFTLQLFRVSGYNSFVPSRTLTSICTIAVISTVLLEKRFIVSDIVLNNPILIFIGKISYGVYLFHLMIPYIAYDLFTPINNFLPHSLKKYSYYFLTTEKFALLILVAFLSWKLIEHPILRLKSRFNYL
jgi:peptidoglycan/LPS O-acetylase OafA/YrhL